MQRFLASVICLLGLSGCIYPGYTYTPPTEKEPMYYVPPVIDRNEQQPAQQQQPLIVPQYVPIPQPYPIPMNGYGMSGYGTQQSNPYMQQVAQKKMDTLSQNYTAHNLNVARSMREETPAAMIDAENVTVSKYITLKHPKTGDTVRCQRADYPCVYAYEGEGYTRVERRQQTAPQYMQQPVQFYQSEVPSVQTPTNTIPRW